jgi:hypothetical protein
MTGPCSKFGQSFNADATVSHAEDPGVVESGAEENSYFGMPLPG